MGFVNNPYTGAVIFAVIVLANNAAGLGCVIGGGVATAAAMVRRDYGGLLLPAQSQRARVVSLFQVLRLEDDTRLRAGVPNFNGLLLG